MRRTVRTRSRSPRPAAVGVSLFPFLAVLICTMGALILLLVVITRQAQLQAAQAVDEKTKKQQEDRRIAHEDVRWRTQQLEASRQTTATQLDEARLELGHLEDHARRLRDQLAGLRAGYDDLERLGTEGSRQREQLEAQLAEVKIQIAEAQRRLAEARQAASERRNSYAVIPYQGPHETYRRPIYIECLQDAIVLQPEGIVLTEADFDGPMGPGNPLAAALRAAREYMLAQGAFDPEKSGEPYPLLLVRPEGIAAFYAARTAMQSWGSEFGYELIGEDWKLDFQAPNPQLAEVIRRAVDTARVRQKRLARAAPRHYRHSPQQAEYRAAPTRGGVMLDGGPFDGGPFDGGPFDDGQSESPSQRPFGMFDDRREPSGAERPGSGFGAENTAGGVASGQGETFNGPPRESQPSMQDHRGGVRRPGEWQPEQKTTAERPPAGRTSPERRRQHLESLAKTRGRNWGLPDAAGGSVPITRPIRVECHDDRLVIVPERGLTGSKAIPLGPRTEESVDELISSVWEHMDSWGIAGRGMYWRPVLNVYVAPGAEQRCAELETLLDDSGLMIQKRH